MILYIDPGTGSMLFTILIGVLGALVYAFRNVLMKAKFAVTGGRKSKKDEANRTPVVIFTDSKRYWNLFRPICDELEKRQIPTLYLTASEDAQCILYKIQVMSGRNCKRCYRKGS